MAQEILGTIFAVLVAVAFFCMSSYFLMRYFNHRYKKLIIERNYIMNNSTPLDIPAVSLDIFETKDGRTPPCIVAHIGGKAVPLTFNYRTIRYVLHLLREENEQ